ncbi:MAG: hypothetical protein AAGI28_01590 [Pseudomonadota bacterium]
MNSLSLEKIDPSAIQPRKRQWRKYKPDQLKAAKRMLERTGDAEIPPLVDRDNRVVFGEEFVLAAKELGLETVTVVRSSRLSPDEFRVYAMNAQKILDMGEFDEELLAEELRELEEILGSEALTDLAYEEGEPHIAKFKVATEHIAHDSSVVFNDLQTATIRLIAKWWDRSRSSCSDMSSSEARVVSTVPPVMSSPL